jgi:membrane fusion protein, multidrug efflux system
VDRHTNLLFITASLLATAAGCQRGLPKVPAAEPPAIPVAHPVQRYVTDYLDYTGRTNAKDAVVIQPRVTGQLVKMPFREGAEVKKGDLLFEIDPRPYQAQYEAAQAQVALYEASLRYAKATNERFRALAEKQPGAVSARELDQYQALEDQAIANLKLANANLESAKLNLDWTKVTSPIDGRISRYYLTHGNLVNQDMTQLTTVMSMDPMYVYFDMDEPTFLRVNRAITEGSITPVKDAGEPRPVWSASTVAFLASPLGPGPFMAATSFNVPAGAANVEVLMGLQGEEGYPHRGSVNFVDNQVNPGTGSIAVRGQFPNPKLSGNTQLLVPGMFVRIRLPIDQPHPALLVLDRVITSDQGLKYVYVVDVDGDKKTQQKPVTLGPLQEDGFRVITKGLKAEDWVVISGLQQVRPQMLIQPQKAKRMPPLGAPVEFETPPSASKAK